jgi:hypothetical protein
VASSWRIGVDRAHALARYQVIQALSSAGL